MSQKNQTLLVLIFAAVSFLLWSPSQSFAACASPAGVAGAMIYNADWHVPQYCNNTSWIGMGKAMSTANAPLIASIASTNAQDVWGDGSYIYVADGTGGIDAYTFNGTTLTFKATNATNSTGALDVWGDGTYIYVADGAGGIDAYTFNGTAFTFKATNTTNSTAAQGVWGDGTYIYVADDISGIDAYTFDGTTFTHKASDTVNTETASAIWGDGSNIYAADKFIVNNGPDAYTFSGTAFTYLATNIVNSPSPRSVWGHANPAGGGNYVYVADGAGGIDAYTFNGTAFTFLATNTANSTGAQDVWGDGTYIYVADGAGGIDAYTFNGTAFTFVKSVATTNALGVTGWNNYIFLADGTGGLKVFYPGLLSGCPNPSGAEGTIMYNKDQRVMQFCNGTAWQAMGSNGGSWKQVATGQDHTCGIKFDDTLWCWGSNSNGQLGDNSTTERYVPTPVNGGGTWKQVSLGQDHTCGIKLADNSLWCWGKNSGINDRGQLGDGTTTDRWIPTAVSGGGTWKQVDAGYDHNCGIKLTDNSLWCWGENTNGRLGDNTTTVRLVPTAISGGGTWKQVSAGVEHTCGIKTNDSLWCWGSNNLGQLGDNTSGTDRHIPTAISGGGTWKQVSAGSSHTCGIKTNDSLWCWGYNGNGKLGDNTTTQRLIPTAISGGGTWEQVDAGYNHNCGIKLDDSFWCWGDNVDGRLGDNTTTDRWVPTVISGGGTWKEVSAHWDYTCGIKNDNTLLCWGSNDNGNLGDNSKTALLAPMAINGGGTWKHLSSSGASVPTDIHHTCGVKADDTLWCWGYNGDGEVGDNTTTDRWIPVAVNGGGTWKQVVTGNTHTCGIKLADNSLWCWGDNGNGMIGDNTSGTDRLIPTAISGGGAWKQVSAGGYHTCGIKTDDTLWCWGGNADGRLGDNTTLQRNIPTAINGGGTWKQVNAGGAHTCGIKADDTLWCWGDNAYGQLGDNTTTDRWIPTAVNGGGTWKQVSAGSGHSCGIKIDNSLWCWGRNTTGRLGDNSTVQKIIPTAVNGGGTWKQVSAGSHTCGIKTDDSLWCWGGNLYGQLGDNTSGTDRLIPTIVNDGGPWKQVSAALTNTCGIKTDDTVWCWGNNAFGQLTATDESAPYRLTGVTPWCVNPSAKPGTLLYNNDFNRLQFCNGGGWMSVGK